MTFRELLQSNKGKKVSLALTNDTTVKGLIVHVEADYVRFQPDHGEMPDIRNDSVVALRLECLLGLATPQS